MPFQMHDSHTQEVMRARHANEPIRDRLRRGDAMIERCSVSLLALASCGSCVWCAPSESLSYRSALQPPMRPAEQPAVSAPRASAQPLLDRCDGSSGGPAVGVSFARYRMQSPTSPAYRIELGSFELLQTICVPTALATRSRALRARVHRVRQRFVQQKISCFQQISTDPTIRTREAGARLALVVERDGSVRFDRIGRGRFPPSQFSVCLAGRVALPPDEASSGDAIVVELPQDNVLWFDPNAVTAPTAVTMTTPTPFGWRESVPYE